jgi:hypothetical protein
MAIDQCLSELVAKDPGYTEPENVESRVWPASR